MHRDSLGLQLLDECHRIHDEVIEKELAHAPWGQAIKLFRRIARAVAPIPKVRGIWQRMVTDSLYHVRGPDWSPVIRLNLEERRWQL
jgi:hypothetical protein